MRAGNSIQRGNQNPMFSVDEQNINLTTGQLVEGNGKVKMHASGAYHKDLGLSNRILYAHAYLLAKI
jgi:tRNA A-37 threonylcarbamoyl transferase component Bud32